MWKQPVCWKVKFRKGIIRQPGEKEQSLVMQRQTYGSTRQREGSVGGNSSPTELSWVNWSSAWWRTPGLEERINQHVRTSFTPFKLDTKAATWRKDKTLDGALASPQPPCLITSLPAPLLRCRVSFLTILTAHVRKLVRAAGGAAHDWHADGRQPEKQLCWSHLPLPL